MISSFKYGFEGVGRSVGLLALHFATPPPSPSPSPSPSLIILVAEYVWAFLISVLESFELISRVSMSALKSLEFSSLLPELEQVVYGFLDIPTRLSFSMTCRKYRNAYSLESSNMDTMIAANIWRNALA